MLEEVFTLHVPKRQLKQGKTTEQLFTTLALYNVLLYVALKPKDKKERAKVGVSSEQCKPKADHLIPALCSMDKN